MATTDKNFSTDKQNWVCACGTPHHIPANANGYQCGFCGDTFGAPPSAPLTPPPAPVTTSMEVK